MTPQQLKQIFGKRIIQEISNEKLKELFDEIKNTNKKINELNTFYASASDDVVWYYWLKVQVEKYILDEKEKLYNYWERLKSQVADKKVTKSINYIDVEVLKQRITFEDILGKPDWQSGNRARYKCPLHNEKTASFTVYLDQNTCHCYGCGFNNDVIGFYQELYNCDFKTAIINLNN